MWAVGLVLYELFLGVPLYAEAVTYAEVARPDGELAAAAARAITSLRDKPISDSVARLLGTILVRAPAARPTAAQLCSKNVFRRADDTVERRRVEVAAFFSNPDHDLRLYREVKDLFNVFINPRRFVVTPAARLSDIAALLASDLCPRLISFSGPPRPRI
jgi:serine/threonine protein kinase